MPVYKFACDCGFIEEGLFKIDENPPCSKCGETRRKVPMKFSSIIPPWMTDEGRVATMRQREFNNSEEGRKQRRAGTHEHTPGAGYDLDDVPMVEEDTSEILGTQSNPGHIGPDNHFPNLTDLGGELMEL